MGWRFRGAWLLHLSSALTVTIWLAGCGSAAISPRPTAALPSEFLASAQGWHIEHGEMNHYLTYVRGFYHWAADQQFQSTAPICPRASARSSCLPLRQRVLARLIEEHVVAAYANRHHIRLSPADQARIDDEMVRLEGDRTAGTSVFHAMGVSYSFMRVLLQKQILAQRVQKAVIPASLSTGFAFHLRRIALIRGTRPLAAVFRLATEIVNGERTVPGANRSVLAWVAPFRVPAVERRRLSIASLGHFIGPFPLGKTYSVVQVLARSQHRFGRPAREILDLRFFRRWLIGEVRSAAPHCFAGTTRRVPCPQPINEG